jgi:2-dehydro-3-deoxyphosphogluconate aldolase/(4S)-4-hydroxy-2-oxoglutarate aldolase
MEQRDAVLDVITTAGVVAIIRRSAPFDAVALSEALANGGVRILEITLNSHEALRSIEQVRRHDIGDIIVGAGTVRNARDARAAIDAGAEFLVAPNFNAGAVGVANAAGLAMLPGVATPTEAVAAFESGCKLLKLFPAAALGADFLRLIRDPLPDIKFMATGGIDNSNMADFFRAGAVAVGLGSSLVGKQDETPEVVRERAATVIRTVAEARNG